MTQKNHSAEHTEASGYKPTGDRFVDSCFTFDLVSEKEERSPSGIDLLKDVPHLIKQKDYKTVWQCLEKGRETYPDFDFVYIWQAFICQKNSQPEKAGTILTQGLKQARQKHLLCDRMGLLAFETGHIKEAVKWWIRSIALIRPGNHRLIWEPFLYLAYVAKGCGSEPLFNRLSRLVARICPQGELKFETAVEQQIFEQAKTLPRKSVLKAVEIGTAPFADMPVKDSSPDITLKDQTTPKAEEAELPGEKQLGTWIALSGLVLLLIIVYLFLSLSGDPDPAPPIPSETPAAENHSQNKVEPSPRVPENNPAETQVNTIPEAEVKKVAPAEDIPAPHKEKLQRLKVKTKTAHPDILKKTE